MGNATESPPTLSSLVCSVTEMTPLRVGATAAALGGGLMAGTGAETVVATAWAGDVPGTGKHIHSGTEEQRA